MIEAIIATFILLLFVLSVTHLNSPDKTAEAKIIHTQTLNALHALDMNGSLRQATRERDLSTIRNQVAHYSQNRHVAIVLTGLNTTSGETRFTNQYTTTFPIPGTAKQQRLRLWYRDATAPNVSINGQYVTNHTDSLTDSYESINIGPQTITGSNTLRIDSVGTANIGYSVDSRTVQRTGEPPSDTDVFSTTYLVSGGNGVFAPAEVTVLSWY